jgi:hypothetical protein
MKGAPCGVIKKSDSLILLREEEQLNVDSFPDNI